MIPLKRNDSISILGQDEHLASPKPDPTTVKKIAPPLNKEAISSMIGEYKERSATGIAIVKELSDLIGPTFLPRVLSSVAQFALYKDPTATEYASAPLPYVVKFMPESITSKLDLVADIVNVGTELNLIPKSKLEALANNGEEASKFIKLIKESLYD